MAFCICEICCSFVGNAALFFGGLQRTFSVHRRCRFFAGSVSGPGRSHDGEDGSLIPASGGTQSSSESAMVSVMVRRCGSNYESCLASLAPR